VSYFPEKESKLPLNILLALFNSKLLDWFFRIKQIQAEAASEGAGGAEDAE
jgi:hypothetical protein